MSIRKEHRTCKMNPHKEHKKLRFIQKYIISLAGKQGDYHYELLSQNETVNSGIQIRKQTKLNKAV